MSDCLKTCRGLLAMLLALSLFLACVPASAEEEFLQVLSYEGEGAEDGSFPELNENGFLDDGEFIYENPADGIWRYCSRTLRVEILRKEQEKPKEIWFEAEVWAAEGENFRMIANDPEKRMKSLEYPYKIARNQHVVLAVNADFAHLRISQRNRTGILIRDGEIVSTSTWAAGSNHFPNLDTLAMFPDGNMQVFESDELEAEQYLEMGATDVLAFGPIMIRDGQLNVEGLEKYGTSSAQRTAIGMIEPGHYMAMMLEGRHSRSRGAGVSFLAERMLERGCQVAMNLDGGQSSTILFMGRQICKVVNSSGRDASARKSAEILGIGYSDQTAGMNEKMSGGTK